MERHDPYGFATMTKYFPHTFSFSGVISLLLVSLEVPVDSWEETLEVKDSWEMEDSEKVGPQVL
jgi:hypothetical protein